MGSCAQQFCFGQALISRWERVGIECRVEASFELIFGERKPLLHLLQSFYVQLLKSRITSSRIMMRAKCCRR